MSAPSLSVREAISFAWRHTVSNFWRLLLVAIIGVAIFTVLGAVGSVLELLPVGDGDPSSTAPDPTSLLDDPTDFLLNPTAYQTSPVTYLTPRNGINLVVTVLYVVVSLYLFLGVTRIALAVTAGAKVTVSQLFAFRGYGRYLGGTGIHVILMVVGVGVPVGISVAISTFTDHTAWTTIGTVIGFTIAVVITMGFVFFGYVIIDQDCRVVSGIRQSHEMVRPHLVRLLGLYGLVGGVMILVFTAAWLMGNWMGTVGFLIALPLVVALVIGLFEFSIASAYRQLSGQSTP